MRWFTLSVVVVFMNADAIAAPRTVPCTEPVQSAKRGLAVGGNDYPDGMSLTQADLDVLAPGVSWFYNWSASSNVLDAHARMEFLPMAWGHAGDNAAVAAWLTAHPSTSIVLSANEPNLGSQANMTTAACATFLNDTAAIAGGRRVIGPHLAAGAGPTEYRNGVHDALAGGLSASAIHIYETNNDGLRYWVTLWPHEGWLNVATAPSEVWVKEINHGNGGADEATVINYMIYAIDLMERDTRVSHYAWWKDRRKFTGAGGFTRAPTHFILSNNASGALTALGALYVAMPVHDAELFYRLPGRLQVERYANISGFSPPNNMNGNVSLARTSDSDGVLDVGDLDSGKWIELNVDVPIAGTWTVELRGKRAAAGTSTIALQRDGTTLASLVLTTTANAYAQTAATQVSFSSAGRQTLRLLGSADTSDTALNWIAFTSPEGDPGPTGSTGASGEGTSGSSGTTDDTSSDMDGVADDPDPGAPRGCGGCHSTSDAGAALAFVAGVLLVRRRWFSGAFV